jgi:hypothetical protein
MRKLIELLIVAICIAGPTIAAAKNKENCLAIGGKWLPGSATDPEKGACIFLIRGNPQKDWPVDKNHPISSADCFSRGGKVINGGSQCSVNFENANDSPKKAAPKKSSSANPAPVGAARPCPAYQGDPCDGKPGSL